MDAMSTTEGPMVPARTLRSVFLPEEGSTSSNFLSLIAGSCVAHPAHRRANAKGEPQRDGEIRRGPQRALHGQRAESRRWGTHTISLEGCTAVTHESVASAPRRPENRGAARRSASGGPRAVTR